MFSNSLAADKKILNKYKTLYIVMCYRDSDTAAELHLSVCASAI